MKTTVLVLLLTAFVSLLFLGCGKRDNGDRTAAHQTPDASVNQAMNPEQGSAVGQTALMRFRTEVCVDRDGTGTEAFRMLVPSDWQFVGGIRWILDNPGMPATGWLRASHPSLPQQLEMFPSQSFFWSNSPLGQQINPPGSRYYGAEVRTPIGPVQALKSIVLRRFRGSVEHISVMKEEHLPDLAAAFGVHPDQPGMSADGGMIRVKYVRQGVSVEEQFFTLIESLAIPMRSVFGNFTSAFWTVSYTFSVTAPEGQLDSLGGLFRTMASSIRVNPQWVNTYIQVINFLIRNEIKRIRNIGELSRIISQTHREISEDNMRSWEERQGVYDRLSERFSQNIRSVDEYYDPVSERPVELPAGYQNAWVNGLGEYVISEQDDYNPNIGSNQNWQKMERRER